MPSTHENGMANGTSNGLSNGTSNGTSNGQFTNGFHSDYHSSYAKDVGICAMELYVPSQYVEQSELEQFDKVSAGKYTIGLGQQRMGFCSDREDIVSLCLTVVDRLMKRSGIDYKNVGRLEVGTETLIDKSKSVKSAIMQLFAKSHNFYVEGVDNVNACYGGTAALFNCVDWIESSSWDGRYAVVVAADIAVYASGNARCTGGAGAVAMLIGPNAGLVFDRGLRATYMQHVYDFYKPNLSSMFPTVDGQLSLQCYVEALHNCYAKYCEKVESHSHLPEDSVDLDQFDYLLFHSPFTKLVQKSFARLAFQDFLKKPHDSNPETIKLHSLNLKNSYTDKEVEKVFLELSREAFRQKTDASLLVARNVGNMYTASLYGGLASLLACHSADELKNKRVGFFSYGSGLASSMFSGRLATGERLKKLIGQMPTLHSTLESRTRVTPQEFDDQMRRREETYNAVPYTPVDSTKSLTDSTYFLTDIDSMYRRQYSYKNAPLI